MTLTDEVRAACARIAAEARLVRIDLDALAEAQPAKPPALAEVQRAEPSALAEAQSVEPPALDPERHYLEGDAADVADYMLALDAINFGSGWFPTLRKRMSHGEPVSGYFTVAWNLADHVRTHGPLTSAWLARVSTIEIAEILGQRPDHELMSLYAQALRELGRFLEGPPDRPARRALDLVADTGGSGERLAQTLARAMAMFDDNGFYKRAQIVPNDLALAGVAEFDDLDRLTIFADNLVPHVLRCDGVLVYDESLSACIDSGRHLTIGGAEREIRACAVHACESISRRTGVPAREIDAWLWTRGQQREYKARPRHRCRTVFY
jgi:hypothetical protein